MGRFLTSGEVVHHRNGVPDDNTLGNLEVQTRGAHQSAHVRSRRHKHNDPKILAKVKAIAGNPRIPMETLGISQITVARICRENGIRWISRRISVEAASLTEELVREALQGRTTLQAAKHLGVHHMTLRNRFPHLLTKRSTPGGLDAEMGSVIDHLMRSDMTVAAVAKHFHVHEQTIRRSIKRWKERGAIPDGLAAKLRRVPGPKRGSQRTEPGMEEPPLRRP